ncbi:hypothetical protein ABID21_005005 [Pseudorhizobium tarimense]|uniref:Uncharacterized protein n=1 Tax=Pseudorhizobium tarimense TaxID=1079109 RepID=A0ABV2HEA0_9HYPH
MNEFSGYAHPIRGGWWAMTRFAAMPSLSP